jgi:hypothetical protein
MPLDPLTAQAIINAGSQVSGGILGYIGQRQTNKTNLKLAEDARRHDINMWKMQNEYNTPFMQMQRLKEAGLNPNLMYGQGTTGNASSPQKAPVPEVSNELASLAQMSLAPVLSMYQDWRVKNAQIENLKANAEATRQNAALTALRQITQDYTNRKLKDESDFWLTDAENRSYKLQGEANITRFKAHTAQRIFNEALPSQIKQIMLRNNLLEQQIRSQSLENDLNEKLKPLGVTSRDNLILRLITNKLSPKKGSNKPNILTDPLGHLKYSIRNPFGN